MEKREAQLAVEVRGRRRDWVVGGSVRQGAAAEGGRRKHLLGCHVLGPWVPWVELWVEWEGEGSAALRLSKTGQPRRTV